MKCVNCGNTHSCGCQKRSASDGKQCCTICIAKYEQQLVAIRNAQNLANAGKTIVDNI